MSEYSEVVIGPAVQVPELFNKFEVHVVFASSTDRVVIEPKAILSVANAFRKAIELSGDEAYELLKAEGVMLAWPPNDLGEWESVESFITFYYNYRGNKRTVSFK